MSQENLIGLLQYLARSLVRDPNAVQITTEENETALTLTLKVAPEDMGRVIGKEGKTAKAIRSLMKAASERGGKKVVVEISEESQPSEE